MSDKKDDVERWIGYLNYLGVDQAMAMVEYIAGEEIQRLQSEKAELVEFVYLTCDKIIDMFEQLTKGRWIDDHEHPVVTNRSMVELQEVVKKAMALAAKQKKLNLPDLYTLEEAQRKVVEEILACDELRIYRKFFFKDNEHAEELKTTEKVLERLKESE